MIKWEKVKFVDTGSLYQYRAEAIITNSRWHIVCEFSHYDQRNPLFMFEVTLDNKAVERKITFTSMYDAKKAAEAWLDRFIYELQEWRDGER
jgi:hypothetical protein